ncbi:conjugal transfer protein TrbH [Ensifer adhaerens]|uniref:conjugal transfer protein TrbH n=1 Tax=Ensifer adhaerens TaxID=106592 RepID=UPI0015C31EDA|nr:conjugal transfer protein TrbH [Ensifer adhaerens]
MSAETAIAGDMASRFVEAMGNEKPLSVHVSPATDRSGEALQTALKLWGFPVLTEDEKAGAKKPVTEVAYGTTAFEDIILVRLSTPVITLTRAYRTNLEGAQPATPLAVARHR